MSETCRGHLWDKIIVKLFASSWCTFLTYIWRTVTLISNLLISSDLLSLLTCNLTVRSLRVLTVSSIVCFSSFFILTLSSAVLTISCSASSISSSTLSAILGSLKIVTGWHYRWLRIFNQFSIWSNWVNSVSSSKKFTNSFTQASNLWMKKLLIPDHLQLSQYTFCLWSEHTPLTLPTICRYSLICICSVHWEMKQTTKTLNTVTLKQN